MTDKEINEIDEVNETSLSDFLTLPISVKKCFGNLICMIINGGFHADCSEICYCGCYDPCGL
jgi:hypothetical protein